MKTVYLICGVSGSGKTWVAKQLEHKFTYVPHDEHIESDDLIETLKKTPSAKPFITECPFGERILKEQLEKADFKVEPYFVLEAPSVIRTRFRRREGKEPQQSVMTRAVTIRKRIDEWNAPYGTSLEILEKLRDL